MKPYLSFTWEMGEGNRLIQTKVFTHTQLYTFICYILFFSSILADTGNCYIIPYFYGTCIYTVHAQKPVQILTRLTLAWSCFSFFVTPLTLKLFFLVWILLILLNICVDVFYRRKWIRISFTNRWRGFNIFYWKKKCLIFYWISYIEYYWFYWIFVEMLSIVKSGYDFFYKSMDGDIQTY